MDSRYSEVPVGLVLFLLTMAGVVGYFLVIAN